MIHVSCSFCMMMLHSLWQAALILMLYNCFNRLVYKNNAPLAKRDFLYTALLTQLILSAFTFSLYFFNARSTGTFSAIMENISTFTGVNNIRLITPWIFSLYVFMIVYKMVRAVYGWYHFKQLYKCGLQKPTVELKLFTELKAHHFGIKRKVKLWLSSSIQTPVTFGFVKPVILLPVALVNQISIQQAETLILHELTHIRTNDYLLNWFLISAETIFFFNPFVINLCKKIRLEREKNCDINVVSFEYSPALYAETLLQAERIKQLVPAFQLAAVDSKKHLLHRIRFFSNNKMPEQSLPFNIVAPLIGLVLLFMLSSAVLFQSGNASLQIDVSSGIPYLPVSKYVASDQDFSNNLLQKTKKAENIANKTEAERQLIINKIKDPSPVSKPVVASVAKVNVFQAGEIQALPVAKKENDAARQIIVKEEGSGSASVKVYYLSFEDGKWILQPEWVITAKEIIADSLLINDSSLKKAFKRVIPAQQ